MSVSTVTVSTTPTLLAAYSETRKGIVIQNGLVAIYLVGRALGSGTLTSANGLYCPPAGLFSDSGDQNERETSLGGMAKMARGPYYAVTASGTSSVVVHENE